MNEYIMLSHSVNVVQFLMYWVC